MKRSMLLAWVGGVATAWAAAAQETVIENFETQKTLIAEQSATRGFAMEYAAAPVAPRGMSAKLSYVTPRNKWVDFQVPLMRFSGFAVTFKTEAGTAGTLYFDDIKTIPR